MAISRGQITKQVEGKLRGAKDEKKKKKRILAKLYSKKSKVFKI
jgi:hypothetical protein